MEDTKILDLYFERNESAITETDKKYGKYCHKVASNILIQLQDVEECINDTYLNAWNSIPPTRPNRLATYLGKICRNIAINIYEKLSAAKRGGSQIDNCLEELEDIVGNNSNVDDEINLELLTDSINIFLRTINKEARILFVKRYFEMSSIKDIAIECNVSESKVKMSLLRTRDKLKRHLIQEGYVL